MKFKQTYCCDFCGKEFKYPQACARHEMSGKCHKATTPDPAPETKPEKRKKRKRTVAERFQIAEDFYASPLSKYAFAKKRKIPKTTVLNACKLYDDHKKQKEENPDLTLTRKELESRSKGSGETCSDLRVINTEMTDELLEYVRRYRGPAPSHHRHYWREDMWGLIDDATQLRLPIEIEDLVAELSTIHDEMGLKKEFDEVEPELWSRRMRAWCKRNGLSQRKFNQKQRSPEKEQETANRCRGTEVEFERVRKEGDRVANMDETSVRILGMHASSYHWTGAQDVPVSEEATSKLTLSMPVLWFDDGTMEVMVLWSDGKHKEFKWTQHSGIWWLRAPSKMTRKESYPEILKFFFSRGKVIDVYFDDEARGHNGVFPDCFMKTLGKNIRRVRILGGCTGYNQPADRPQANKVLKKVIRRAMQKHRLRKTLKREAQLLKGLTAVARIEISEVLKEVKNAMNTSIHNTQGVKNAFNETLLTGKKHSRLAKLLKSAKKAEYKPYGSDRTKENVCECEFCFNDKDKHACWYERTNLWAPLRTGQDPSDPTFMLFMAKARDKAETIWGIVLEKNTAYLVSDKVKLLPAEWWNEYNIQYFQQAEDPDFYQDFEEQIQEAVHLNLKHAKSQLGLAQWELEQARERKRGRSELYKLRKNVQQTGRLVERAEYNAFMSYLV